MTHDTLRFVHSDRPPASDLRVFDSLSREWLGAEFTFRVVGSSHYVSAPAYRFHELSSCEPVAADDATAIPLERDASSAGGPERRPTISYEADRVACETVVERRPLSAFPADREFDLAYRFGPDAHTTVDLGSRGYETYHTYPEFDLALYTRTVFRRVGDRRVEAAAPSRARFSTD